MINATINSYGLDCALILWMNNFEKSAVLFSGNQHKKLDSSVFFVKKDRKIKKAEEIYSVTREQ